MMRRLAIAFTLAVGGSAAAAPRPDGCDGPLPRRGEAFAGPVQRVIDGDSLCVATPRGLVEVRVADFHAEELSTRAGKLGRRRATAALQGKVLACVARERSFDRIVGVCRLGREPLVDALRRAGVPEGGR